jgi:ferric-dicitrate binding protein FerR (iron transport regulator)
MMQEETGQTPLTGNEGARIPGQTLPTEATDQQDAAIYPLPRHRYRWLQIAAVLVLAVGLTVWFARQSGTSPVTFSGAQQAALDDGSRVIMEPDAQMKLLDGFGKKERKVAFSGKAVFDIKQDAQTPFVVVLGKTEIKVLGTRFMVDFQPEEHELTVHVSSGRIMVTDHEKGESVILSQGMLLKRSKPQLPFEVAAHVQDIGKKSLVFRDTPLEEVLKTISAVYNITVDVEDSTLLQKSVTTNFENESIDNIMATIAFMTNTRVEKAGQQNFSIR